MAILVGNLVVTGKDSSTSAGRQLPAPPPVQAPKRVITAKKQDKIDKPDHKTRKSAYMKDMITLDDE